MNRFQIEQEERRVRLDHLAARRELIKTANPEVWAAIAAQRQALAEAIFIHFLENSLLPPVWGIDPFWDQAVARKGQSVIESTAPAIKLQVAA